MKSPWKSPWLLSAVVIVAAGLSTPMVLGLGSGSPLEVNAWQLMANPGQLSQAHANLENDCAVCHTPLVGVSDASCVQCHANSSTILLLQPTAFHASIGSCSSCHREHAGRDAQISAMDHQQLADIVNRSLSKDIAAGDREANSRARHIAAWAGESVGTQFELPELALDCNECHSKEDPHVGYFGTSCAACHVTAHWQIPSYVHPADLSTDCEQCHRPPLSHSSPMFASMCTKMLGKPGTQVVDCHACHQIASWFDIRGAPWHKQKMGHGYGR